MTSKVETTHTEYDANKKDWQIVRDCVAGEEAVKSRKEQYLPYKSKEDPNAKSRYERYISRASFVNFVARTRDALFGTIYRKDPDIELPENFSWALEDVDGSGVDIVQSSRQTTLDVIETGRAGLLVDFPQTTGSVTNAQLSTVHPTIAKYSAENILNWHTETINNRLQPVHIVLRESVLKQKNEFEFESAYQYRVLRLVNGVYVQSVYIDDVKVDEFEPRNQSGGFFDYIPFVFVGSENNNPDPDKSPLIDIARINLSHYRNTADMEESLFLIGQAMLEIHGLDQAWIESNQMSKISVGSSSALLLPQGAGAKFLQPSSDSMLASQLQKKEEQIQMLGGRLLKSESNLATDTVRMINSGEASVLESIAKNISTAYMTALSYATDFIGSDINSFSFSLNTDFFSDQMDPQRMAQLVNWQQNGIIAKSDVRAQGRQGEIIAADRTDEQIEQELEQEGF